MFGVLVMSYGSIYNIDDVERFYTHIIGRKPSYELLEELRNRFLAIGGYSPLNEISRKQAEKLQKFLGSSFKVFLAFKHINPYIEEVVKNMEDYGIERAVALILSPFYSNYNISDYFKRAKSDKIDFIYVYGYYNDRELIDAYARRIRSLLNNIDSRDDLFFLFSAHSLPEKILPDPYPEQLHFVVNQLVRILEIEDYCFAYQSAGKSGGKWLGPDIIEVIEKLDNKYKTIISCPIGFISDHLEVLYDIDIEAKQLAISKGKNFYRMKLFNDDDDFINILKKVVLEKTNWVPPL